MIDTKLKYIIYIFSGEIGGFMGLLIGASVISIVELMDLVVFNWLHKALIKRKMNRQVSSISIQQVKPALPEDYDYQAY